MPRRCSMSCTATFSGPSPMARRRTMQLKGRGVLLTGASGGIGKALADRLAGEGAQLLLTARNESALAPRRDELTQAGESVHICVADLTTAAGRQSLMEWICRNRWPLA